MHPSLNKIKKILIARIEVRIGDAVLTLPLAGILKANLPNVKIAFLGNTEYAQAIIEKSTFVDEFYDWSKVKDLSKVKADAILLASPRLEVAKAAWKAKIPIRVGMARRWYFWLYANRRAFLKKRAVNLHETQLVTSFLPPLGIQEPTDIDGFYRYYGWHKEQSHPFPNVISDTKHNIILHPKSKGSAPEWPLQHYHQLANILDPQNFNVILSGTLAEKEYMQKTCPQLFELPHITDITGQYNLADYINIVEQSDCLVANSTGPLHLAAAAGINTIGLYAPVRPQHPGRWKPIGKRVKILCKGQPTDDKNDLHKIAEITPADVKVAIMERLEK